MSNLLTSLVQSVYFPQADALWADGLGNAVLSPFYACLLANLADNEPAAWYQDFVGRTRSSARLAMSSGDAMAESELYWQNSFHVKLKERLVQTTGVEADTLHVILPLAVHTGYEVLAAHARRAQMSVQAYSQQQAAETASALPTWAAEVVSAKTLAMLTGGAQAALASAVVAGSQSLSADAMISKENQEASASTSQAEDLQPDAFEMGDLVMEAPVAETLDLSFLEDNQAVTTEAFSPSDGADDMVLELWTEDAADTAISTEMPTEMSSVIHSSAPADTLAEELSFDLPTEADDYTLDMNAMAAPAPIVNAPAASTLAGTVLPVLSFETPEVLDDSKVDLPIISDAVMPSVGNETVETPFVLTMADDELTAEMAGDGLAGTSVKPVNETLLEESFSPAAPTMMPTPAGSGEVLFGDLEDAELHDIDLNVGQGGMPVSAQEIEFGELDFSPAETLMSAHADTQRMDGLHKADDINDLQVGLPTPAADTVDINPVAMTPRPVVPRKKSNSPALMAGAGFATMAVLAAGIYWGWGYYKSRQAPEVVPVPEAQVAAPAVATTPSRLSITVGQAGELYACQAQVGTDALSTQVLSLLQNNFSNTVCVIDINEEASPNLAGFERLTSLIAVLKSVPFASMELEDNVLSVNAPNSSDVTRLVQDLGALMTGTGVTVRAMPPLDQATAINDSLTKAQSALARAGERGDIYALARALSLQIIDMSQGTVPEANKALLAQAVAQLRADPSAHLIIAVYSDDMGDTQSARMQTQVQADAIKNYLVSQGVGEHQLSTIGVGSDFPVSDNQTDLGRFKNRRVEFIVYSDAVMQALSTPLADPAVAPTPAPADELAMNSGADPEAPVPEILSEAAPAPAPNTPAQPVLGVSNGQIVEQGYPQGQQPASPQQPAAPAQGSSDIPDDLLAPIGSDRAGTGVADGQVSR